METVDLSKFMEETKSADTLAYDYALELAHLAVSEMSKQGLTKKELAERMGVSPQRLANLLNTQPNMTLKSVAQLALALDIRVEFSSEPAFSSETPYKCVESDEGDWGRRPLPSRSLTVHSSQHDVTRRFSVLKGGLVA